MNQFTSINLTEEQADRVATGVFLVGLGVLYYLNAWWPGILLVVLAAMLSRYYFLGRIGEIVFASIAIVALFSISYFDIAGQYIIPLILILLGGALIYKEIYFSQRYKGPRDG